MFRLHMISFAFVYFQGEIDMLQRKITDAKKSFGVEVESTLKPQFITRGVLMTHSTDVLFLQLLHNPFSFAPKREC